MAEAADRRMEAATRAVGIPVVADTPAEVTGKVIPTKKKKGHPRVAFLFDTNRTRTRF